MAIELQVYIAISDTEPEVAGNPGLLIRSQKQTTLLVDDATSIADTWVLADSRLQSAVDEVVTDVRGQIHVAERANR